MLETKDNPFSPLTPDLILQAAEQGIGVSLESVVHPCNSYVNRVYSLKAEEGDRYVIKFYRPGRWSLSAIEDEHNLLQECSKEEIPVVPPVAIKGLTVPSSSIQTIGVIEGIFFSCFPFKGGRTFDITSDDDYLRIGRLIGNLHRISKNGNAPSRVTFSPQNVYTSFCEPFSRSSALYPEVREEFLELCQNVLFKSEAYFKADSFIRIHGDCHRGNILDRENEDLLLIDFDDMMIGPAVQDLWLLLPDHLASSRREMNLLIEGYETFCSFNRESLRLIETLRFMRNLYFLSWMDSQKEDAGFSQRYPDWGSKAFWITEMEDLRYQGGHALETLLQD